MRLLEAIEEAPDGKWWNPTMPEGWYWEFAGDKLVDSEGRCIQGNAPGGLRKALTRTDWEVVKPEVIEVGDEITIEGLGFGRDGATIHDVEEIRPDGVIHARPRTVAIVEREKCTLIRKGPKVHTFEGVEWFDNGSIIFPHKGGSDPFSAGLRKLVGKTYTMTLKEE